MRERHVFYLLTEAFIKRTVDYKLCNSLSDEAFERFITKMVIEISKESFPKRDYGLTRDCVREIFLDVFFNINKPRFLNVVENNAYSYETTFKEYRMLFAKTKKAATEIIFSLPWSKDTLGGKRSIQKVVALGDGFLVTKNGENRPIDFWLHTLNLYGNGGINE